jgi:CRP-like cAMP-binding protein
VYVAFDWMALELTALALPVFETLSCEEREALASAGDRVEVEGPGVEITQQGDFGHSVFAVLEGDARVVVDGREVGRLSTGDLFGEIAVIASGRRTATVESLSPMLLASFFKRDIWALEKGNTAFAEALRSLRQADDNS